MRLKTTTCYYGKFEFMLLGLFRKDVWVDCGPVNCGACPYISEGELRGLSLRRTAEGELRGLSLRRTAGSVPTVLNKMNCGDCPYGFEQDDKIEDRLQDPRPFRDSDCGPIARGRLRSPRAKPGPVASVRIGLGPHGVHPPPASPVPPARRGAGSARTLEATRHCVALGKRPSRRDAWGYAPPRGAGATAPRCGAWG